MGVAAELRKDAGMRPPAEIVGHHRYRAAKVGKGRSRHAPVFEWQQVRDMVGGRLLQQTEGIPGVLLHWNARMARARHVPAAALARLRALLLG